MLAEQQRNDGGASVGVLGALRRHWIVASLPLILLVGVALALGLNRAPRFTATTNLTVGRIQVDNPAGVGAVIEATRSLASVYSRAIFASSVREDTARRLGEDGLRDADRLSATQLPDSPLIKLSAESSSARRAVELSDAASAALAAYVERQERSDKQGLLLRRYRRAAREYRAQTKTNRRLERRYDREPTDENERAIDRTAVASSTALLRRNALRKSYELAVQSGKSPLTLEVFSRATNARSDRIPKLQIMLLLAVIGGLAAGTALALIRAYRKVRPRPAK